MPKRLITHSEDFHTDDVFATALLLELFPDAIITRTRDEAIIATGDIVYDVGKIYDPGHGRFDHHQAQAGQRPNGITYSAFGLLWREYGVQFCGGDTAVAEQMDQKLVAPIDANDNGQSIITTKYDHLRPFTIDTIIGNLNPLTWIDSVTEDHDTQFTHAVELARQILCRLRSVVQDTLLSQQYLLRLYAAAADKRIILTDKMASVSDIVDQCPELLYLISPRPNGTWGILAVSTAPGSFTPRHPFPSAWRAQSPADLARLARVPDAIFCHATGFYAATRTRDGALALAHRALEA